MALDGAFLHHLKKELEETVLGARVEKVQQPNREELVLVMRTFRDSLKLLLSTRANSPRINLIEQAPENPKQPPMLCMLLRKRLGGAKLCGIRQPGLERVLLLDFDAVNELGDRVKLTMAVEIMGRYSNLILIGEDGKIIDALKRVDAEMSSERLVFPGLLYRYPPAQEKLCLLETEPEAMVERMRALPRDMAVSKAVLSVVQGVSPVVCREAEQFAGRGKSLTAQEMTETEQGRLLFFLRRLAETVRETKGVPYLIEIPGQKPLDFTFLNVEQYGLSAVVSRQPSFSALLERFFGERDRIDRMRARSQDLLRLLSNTSDRINRKIQNQRTELAQCANREESRVFGELLTANQHRIEKGAQFAEVENYYEEGMPILRIPLNPALSASQNAQKYYKDYRKARTAEEKLTEQIAQAEQELRYIDTVFEELSRAATEEDLNEIRNELRGEGYLRTPKEKKRGGEKKPAKAKPIQYASSDGFPILVGRNNRENDELTLRTARGCDIWFHTKNIPGSHTILVTGGKTPSDAAIREAAQIAAQHSRGKDSSQVPVDYTQVRNVSKPSGAKPGMVIYVHYKTLYVTPERNPDGV
ncbi:Rqc2 family fibronectin-binding protein [Yeguia hominis]|uniref:Rqc2 homolog RqcH n=1 Tax=Yeguia hominis TaxID=2763662 RepID=A0A926D977_9FIRM|nr:NFACT RNA binding domain-containing protein [Yeguia hominis]MBC8533649.1 NFACT family protein [Yeguia hominis]